MLALLSFKSINILSLNQPNNKQAAIIVEEDPTSTLLVNSTSSNDENESSKTTTGGVIGVLVGMNGAQTKKEKTTSTKELNPIKTKQFFKAIIQSQSNPITTTTTTTITSNNQEILPICHSAKVLVTLMNGSHNTTTHTEKHRPKTLISSAKKLNQPRHPLIPTSPSISIPTLTIDTFSTDKNTNKENNKKKKEIKVDPKQLKKLKKSLSKPKEARKIISDLKRIQLIDSTTSTALSTNNGNLEECMITCEPNSQCIGYALPPLPSSSSTSTSNPSTPSVFTLLTTPTTILSAAASKSGTFELIGELSGALVHSNSASINLLAPLDRVGIFLYWWGYELSLPPGTIVTLGNVHSVQGPFFASTLEFSFLVGLELMID